MTALRQSRRELVLGVRPTRRSTGWALFESPLAPLDWGIIDVRIDKNVKSLAYIERLIDRYQPGILVIEELGRGNGGRRIDRPGERHRPGASRR